MDAYEALMTRLRVGSMVALLLNEFCSIFPTVAVGATVVLVIILYLLGIGIGSRGVQRSD
jgi:hypothetical protein